MKLSIILTIYNKEKYLRRALDTLLNQQKVQGGEYEVIAVNDGSTDNSADILKEYAHCDNRVRVLTQQNQGLSMARNNGIGPAQGDYIWFVDADDTISPHSVRKICDAMSNHPDVIPIYAQTYGIDKIRNRVNPELQVGKDVLTEWNWEHCGVLWIARKDFLIKNNLRFLPGIYHEDAELTPRMLFLAETVHVVPEVLYTVYRDPNSITQVPRSKRAFDCLTVASRLMIFFKQQGDLGRHLNRMLNYRIGMIINDALFVITQNLRKEQYEFDQVFKDMTELIEPLAKAPVFKYRLEAMLFRCFPGHYSTIYSLLKHLGR